MKIKRILLLILPLALLSGCSASSDVRSKAFVKEIGADYLTRQYVTVKIFDSDNTAQGYGETLLSAIENCEITQNKNFFSGHLEVFASSPNNLGNNLLTLLSNNRISPSCYVMCVENAMAFINNSDGNLSQLIKSNDRNGTVSASTISDVVSDLMGSDKKAAVPTQQKDKFATAVISPNSIVGVLSANESKGLCWLKGGVEDIYLPIEYDNKMHDFYIRKSCTQITAQQENDKIRINIKIRINGNPEENTADKEVENKAVAEKISFLCSETINTTVYNMNADLFGIEKTIKSAGILTDESWADLINKLKFSYEIKISQ